MTFTVKQKVYRENGNAIVGACADWVSVRLRMNRTDEPFPIRPDFIAIHEGRDMLLRVSEREPAMNGVVPIGRPQARDLQRVGANRILIGRR